MNPSCENPRLLRGARLWAGPRVVQRKKRKRYEILVPTFRALFDPVHDDRRQLVDGSTLWRARLAGFKWQVDGKSRQGLDHSDALSLQERIFGVVLVYEILTGWQKIVRAVV